MLATTKQVSFINSLAAERGVVVEAENLTKAAASQEISRLLSLPKQAQKAAQVLTEGMYMVDGQAFKVQRSKTSGNLYAKVLVQENGHPEDKPTARFEYAPGAMRNLRIEDRMTLDQAKQYGMMFGTCCVCGRTLTKRESIEAGIGPICAGGF